MRRKLFATFILIIALFGSVFAQQRTLSGTVTAATDGLSMPGVTVMVKEAGNVGTVTDESGKYTIRVPEDAENLVFSFIGMETMTVKIGTSNVLNVILETSTESLEEVVVTALGIKREVKALGYAQQGMDASELSAGREKI